MKIGTQLFQFYLFIYYALFTHDILIEWKYLYGWSEVGRGICADFSFDYSICVYGKVSGFGNLFLNMTRWL